jgi:hypothetical protein
MNIAALANEQGLLDPARIAKPLRTTVAELAESLGLGLDAVQRRERVGSVKVQTRLREFVELLNIMEPRMGGPLMAYARLRSEPLSGYGRVDGHGAREAGSGRRGSRVDRLGGCGDLRLSLVLGPIVGTVGTLYRAVHPRSGFEPLTGRWSARWGGRFDRVGREALHTSLSPITSMREVVRNGRMQPTLVVALEADLANVVDARASGLNEEGRLPAP